MLVQEGVLDVRNIKGEDEFAFTKEGLEQAEKKIRENEDMQLFLFSIIFNEESRRQPKKKEGEDKYVALKKALNHMEKFNPNFFDVLEKAVRDGRFQGIKLKKR